MHGIAMQTSVIASSAADHTTKRIVSPVVNVSLFHPQWRMHNVVYEHLTGIVYASQTVEIDGSNDSRNASSREEVSKSKADVLLR